MKRLICLLISILICVSLCGCGSTMEDKTTDNQISMFVKLESFRIPNAGWDHVVYHKDTKVIYIISYEGIATIMLDADGKPLLWEGE